MSLTAKYSLWRAEVVSVSSVQITQSHSQRQPTDARNESLHFIIYQWYRKRNKENPSAIKLPPDPIDHPRYPSKLSLNFNSHTQSSHPPYPTSRNDASHSSSHS